MLGRTHMAIGALGAVVAVPLLFETGHWIPALGEVQQVLSHHNQWTSLSKESVYILAAVIGSSVPDLEQKDSLLSRRVEKLGQAVIFVGLVGFLFMTGLYRLPTAWVIAGILAIGVASRSQLMMKLSMGLLAAAVIALGVTGHIPLLTGLLYAVWALISLFTGHRTWTHSALGCATFIAATVLWTSSLHGYGNVADAVAIGYGLHLVADGIAGGVPLLWPVFRQRQGIRLVRTGGSVDHVIGLGATLLFVITAVI